MLAELKRYRKRFGDCNVPEGWAENPKLSRWVFSQRALEKAGELSPERKAQICELRFVWDARISAWETMFAELKRFRDEHGHCNVPRRWLENPRLSRWVSKQRCRQVEGRLPLERKTSSIYSDLSGILKTLLGKFVSSSLSALGISMVTAMSVNDGQTIPS